MRIYFERSGGFMGMHIAKTLDTTALSPEEASSLHHMIDAAGFFELPETPTASPEGADQFHYKLTVEDEERHHSIETTDAAAPDALRPLLRRLTILARSEPR